MDGVKGEKGERRSSSFREICNPTREDCSPPPSLVSSLSLRYLLNPTRMDVRWGECVCLRSLITKEQGGERSVDRFTICQAE